MSRLAIAVALLLASGIALPAHAADPAETPVAVLTRAIARGDILSATDFELQPRAAVAARGALAADAASGREAVRALPAGTMVRAGDLVAPRLVRRGEAVTLSLQGRGFAITTAARALAAGGIGDVVRVVALSTNHSVDGVVTGAGSVRVAAQ
ncbi:flagellar basal body P-ring formation protein FlgA [Sphingomonas sp. CFBP 13714]|uniref:flagellar basal body P-ring formation chaperone FlgA n=1 Tax=Sphingomonas TaxID=13687 RepID=UPI00177FB5F3|nr:flagellar basal body P-ring formation protein FlgA [Sphingomonas sp. CFBP 13714]